MVAWEKQDHFLRLASSALEIMAQDEFTKAETREAKAAVLQRHMLHLSQVLEIADKLRNSDTPLAAALDVIDNLFDARYGRKKEPDHTWFINDRMGRPKTTRAAWAGLKTRSQWREIIEGADVETCVRGQWVLSAPTRHHATLSSGPSPHELYNAARRVESESRRQNIHTNPAVRQMLMTLRRQGHMRMRDIHRLLPFDGRTAAVRVMNWLQEGEWVEKVGKGSGTRWAATSKLRQHRF